MRGAKLYVNGGGSLIQNVTSRRSLRYYLYTIRSAKHLGCKVIMYGCGIGPVTGDADIAKARKVINGNVDVITLREPDSLEELRRFGIDAPEIILASDPAMKERDIMRKVIFPQALRNILPAMGNEFIVMIKETSLASTFMAGEIMWKEREVIKGWMTMSSAKASA